MSVTRIANKAGVSIATVSRVLNNNRTVNPSIAAQVRQAVADLNLDLSSRPVRRRRRRRSTPVESTIAVVSVGQWYRVSFAAPIMSAVVGEISRVAQQQQMEVLLTEMPDADVINPILRRSGVDGAILFVDASVTAAQVLAIQEHLPVVRVMGPQMAPATIDQIGADHISVGYLAAQYLSGLGLTDVAFMSLYPNLPVNLMREHGFGYAAATMALRYQPYVVSDAPDQLPHAGVSAIGAPTPEELVARFAATHTGRRGLFVPRDQETVRIYHLLRANGLEPGRDVIVISCDNEDVRLSTLFPRPASIDLNPAEIADHAVRRLTGRIRDRHDPPLRILVAPRLPAASA